MQRAMKRAMLSVNLRDRMRFEEIKQRVVNLIDWIEELKWKWVEPVAPQGATGSTTIGDQDK